MASFGFPGYSFQPGLRDEMGANGNGARNGTTPPVQEAIEVLGLRLPKRFGAHPIAAPQLSFAPGGMGQIGARGDVTAQALAMLAGLPAGMVMPAPVAPVAPVAPSVPTIPSAQQDRASGMSRPQPQPQREEPQREERRSYQPGEYLTPVEARTLGVPWQPRDALRNVRVGISYQRG